MNKYNYLRNKIFNQWKQNKQTPISSRSTPDGDVYVECLRNCSLWNVRKNNKMSALSPSEMQSRNSPDYSQNYAEYSLKHGAQGPYVVHGGQLTDSGGDSFIPVRKQSPGTKGKIQHAIWEVMPSKWRNLYIYLRSTTVLSKPDGFFCDAKNPDPNVKSADL